MRSRRSHPPVTAAWPPFDPTAPRAVGAAARSQPARARSCCSCSQTSCTTRSFTTGLTRAPYGSRPALTPRVRCSSSRMPASCSPRRRFPRLSRRFLRGTERVRADHAGVGLGPGDRQEHHRSARRSSHTHSRDRSRAARHGATTRRTRMNSGPVKSFNEAADRGSEDGALQRRALSARAHRMLLDSRERVDGYRPHHLRAAEDAVQLDQQLVLRAIRQADQRAAPGIDLLGGDLLERPFPERRQQVCVLAER